MEILKKQISEKLKNIEKMIKEEENKNEIEKEIENEIKELNKLLEEYTNNI